MALPQRRDPDEERQEIRRVELERRAGETETTGSWWLAWWWIWLLILIAAIWFAGWGWGGWGGWWWGQPRAAAVQGTRTGAVQGNRTGAVQGIQAGAVNGPGVAILDATNKQAYVGQGFQVNNAPVQNKVSKQVLWIGANNTTPMLVVLTGPANSAANAKIGQGNQVSVTGTVEKAPPAAQAKKNWGLSDSGAKRLEQEGAYVQATQVQKTNR